MIKQKKNKDMDLFWGQKIGIEDNGRLRTNAEIRDEY